MKERERELQWLSDCLMLMRLSTMTWMWIVRDFVVNFNICARINSNKIKPNYFICYTSEAHGTKSALDKIFYKIIKQHYGHHRQNSINLWNLARSINIDHHRHHHHHPIFQILFTNFTNSMRWQAPILLSMIE